jgi:hypothetical protein
VKEALGAGCVLAFFGFIVGGVIGGIVGRIATDEGAYLRGLSLMVYGVSGAALGVAASLLGGVAWMLLRRLRVRRARQP